MYLLFFKPFLYFTYPNKKNDKTRHLKKTHKKLKDLISQG